LSTVLPVTWLIEPFNFNREFLYRAGNFVIYTLVLQWGLLEKSDDFVDTYERFDFRLSCQCNSCFFLMLYQWAYSYNVVLNALGWQSVDWPIIFYTEVPIATC